ncbi:MAG: hypothetical protein QOD42_2101 [Sphingomonadales bacterium]|jgi:hypothetical protein|nr:hypothetical protein [Sphingomonadales bacterium]
MPEKVGASEEIERTEPERAPLPDPTGLAHTLSPVDLPEPAEPLPHDGLRWTSTIIVLATLILLVFNAHTLRGWAYELHPTDANAKIVSASEGWYDATASIGLNRPVEALHKAWREVMNLRFAGQEPAPPDVRLEE